MKSLFKKLFGNKVSFEKTQAENPFALFDVYLSNLKADIDDDGNTQDALQQSSFLISNEYGEQIEQYNQNAASFFNLPKIERQVKCPSDSKHNICTLKYKDKLLSWQETPNLASDDFEIFMMNKLVDNDIEIRFDVCSMCLSDHSYYALTSEIWQQLEDKYGLEFVQGKFTPMVEFFEPDYVFELVGSRL